MDCSFLDVAERGHCLELLALSSRDFLHCALTSSKVSSNSASAALWTSAVRLVHVTRIYKGSQIFVWMWWLT